MKGLRLAVATIAAAGLGAGGIPAAMAVTCIDTTITGKVDKVLVPEGAFCRLIGVTVTNGSVQADKATFLQVSGSSVSNGDIRAVGVSHGVSIFRTTVLNGNVRLQKSASASVRSSIVHSGNIEVGENRFADVQFNTASNGNIQVEKNVTAVVRGNFAVGYIHCVANGSQASGRNMAGNDLGCL